MRVALYARVSTREQAQEGYSVQAQLNSLKAYCESQNWDIASVYVDEGLSAKDLERTQLKKMIKDIKNNKIDVVLVYRLDRLTRSVLDLYELLDTFDKHDCGFKSATEVYDTTTAMGRLFITIVAALAQWERENMGERISMGLQEKARQGEYPNGFTPFGYDVSNGKLVINEVEASIIRKIYKKYLNGLGAHRIANELNSKNIKTRKGNKWRHTRVMDILTNVLYKGDFYWRGETIKDNHDPIIKEDEWEKVQQLRRSRRNMTSNVSSDYLFSGLIKCPDCGSNLHGNSTYHKNIGKRYYNYRCPKKMSGQCDGNSSAVSEMQIEKQIKKILSNINYTDVIKNTNVEVKEDKKVDVESLYVELESIDKRKKKWQFAWINELISDSDLQKRMKEETSKENSIMKMIDEANKESTKKTNYDIEEVKELLLDITSNWKALKRKEKKELLMNIIKEIKFEKKGRKVMITDVKYI